MLCRLSKLGFIGALQTHPNLPVSTTIPADGMTGWGKLSGSIDEFRYWKARRTGEEVRENYFTQVRGGTNTSVSNAELGVYFKFNEGITTDASIDATVLTVGGSDIIQMQEVQVRLLLSTVVQTRQNTRIRLFTRPIRMYKH